jgi:type VI secretion system protein ImpH
VTDSALERVLARAERLPFLVLVNLLDRLSGAPARVGGRGPFLAEAVRFRHDPSLVFHTRDVGRVMLVQEPDRPARVDIETTFLGLTGAVSPLPLFLTEELAHADEDGALQRDFLDLFHHRLLGLLYRGLMTYQHARSLAPDARDTVSSWILLLSGFDPEHAARRAGLEPGWLLRWAPLFTTYPRNAERLELALRDALGRALTGVEFCSRADPRASTIDVQCFAGRPVQLEDDERPRLGVGMRLGRDSVLGRHVPAPASRVRVSLGPLTAETCARLAPDGDLSETLSVVSRLFVPDQVEVEFELRPAAAPGARLGTNARLGRAWLGSSTRATPLRFRPSASKRAGPCASNTAWRSQDAS